MSWVTAVRMTAFWVLLRAANAEHRQSKKLRKSCGSDFQVDVRVTPQQRYPGQPILRIDQPTRTSVLVGPEDADRSLEFRAGDSSPNGAGCNRYAGVIPDAFVLSQFAAGHEINPVVVFSKPDRRVDRHTSFSKRGEADVALPVNFRRNGSHAVIVNCSQE